MSLDGIKAPESLKRKEKTSPDIDGKKRQKGIQEVKEKELLDMEHNDFLSKDKNERLKFITKPKINIEDVKNGETSSITFNFFFSGKENRKLLKKVTAGQVLPQEVQEIQCNGETYSRDNLEGEFFTKNNKRLKIYTGTNIVITKLRSKQEMYGNDGKGGLVGEYNKKIEDYKKNNPGIDEDIIRQAIYRGIDPKLASLAFKGKQNGISFEESFTQYDRIRGRNFYKEGSDDLVLSFLLNFSEDWQKVAIEYGISENSINSFKSDGEYTLRLDSNSIKNADSLPDGTYLKGEKLLNNPEFSKKLDQVCKNIGTKRDDLIKLMKAESKIDPRNVNSDSNATGLIQFMPNTAKGLGTSVGKIRQMTAVEQLDYVEKYFKQNNRGYELDSLGNLYRVAFYPVSLGKGPNFVFGSEVSRERIIDVAQGNKAISIGKSYITNKMFDEYIDRIS